MTLNPIIRKRVIKVEKSTFFFRVIRLHYSTPQDVIQTTMIEADSSVKKIGKLCDYLRNEVFKNERLYAARNILNESENKSVEYFLKGSKDCLSGCMKLATILNRVYTSGKSYGQKFHESEKEQTNN